MSQAIPLKACTGTTGEQRIIDTYYRAVENARSIRETIGKMDPETQAIGWSAFDTLAESQAQISVYGSMALAMRRAYLDEPGGTVQSAFDAAREEALQIVRRSNPSSSQIASRMLDEVTRDVAVRAATDMRLTLAAKGA